MSLLQAIERVRDEIIRTERDTRYKLQAYVFVLNGLEFYLSKIGAKRHVTGQEFSRGLADFAAKQFGSLAFEVLSSWGITTTDDLGAIVYNLIGIGLMSRREEDRLEDFFSVLDLKTYFEEYPIQRIDRSFIRTVRGA